MIIDLSKHKPSPNNKYLLDANIWIFLFCPLGNAKPQKQRVYSVFYNELLKSGAEICICSTILSEFVNRYIKLDFEEYKWKNNNPDFKKGYRKSTDYQQNIKMLQYIVLNQMLPKATQINDKFDQLEIDDLFKQIDFADFNDAQIAWLAKQDGMTLVTDDGDYVAYKNDIDIVTNNYVALSNQ